MPDGTHTPAIANSRAPLTGRRRIEVAAYAALIDTQLTGTGQFLPRYAAQQLFAQLIDTGIATLHPRGQGSQFTMLGISTISDATAVGILRNWQGAAKARLAGIEGGS